MALYITSENQEMLWNLIHKTPQILQYFSNKTIHEKTEWFKNIIQTFYYQNQYRELSIIELQKINKDTLLYMVQYIKQIVNIPISPEPTDQQFNQRQKEYEKMLDKNVPEKIDFTETVADQAISNMEELIKTHLEQREQELMKYSPPPPQPAQPTNIQYEISSPNELTELNSKITDLETLVLQLQTEITELKKTNQIIQ